MIPINYEKKTTRGKLTPAILGYIAGLIDGEGCIYIGRTKNYRNKSGSYQYHLGVQCGLNHPGPAKMLTSLFCNYGAKGTVIRVRGYKTHYQWMVASKLALRFLKMIYPYLWVKTEQAKLGMEFQRLKSRDRLERKGRILPEEIVQRREVYYRKMKELNAQYNGRVIAATTTERKDTINNSDATV